MQASLKLVRFLGCTWRRIVRPGARSASIELYLVQKQLTVTLLRGCIFDTPQMNVPPNHPRPHCPPSIAQSSQLPRRRLSSSKQYRFQLYTLIIEKPIKENNCTLPGPTRRYSCPANWFIVNLCDPGVYLRSGAKSARIKPIRQFPTDWPRRQWDFLSSRVNYSARQRSFEGFVSF